MYFGIEESTDLKNKNTIIIKFSKNEKKKLKDWYFSDQNGRFTHINPESAQNYHHTFRYIYEYNGYLIFQNKKIEHIIKTATNTYPIELNDAKAIIIKEKCKFLDIAEINKL